MDAHVHENQFSSPFPYLEARLDRYEEGGDARLLEHLVALQVQYLLSKGPVGCAEYVKVTSNENHSHGVS